MGEQYFGHRIKPGQQILITPEAVGIAAAQLLLAAGALAHRVSIFFQNKSLNTIYIGTTNAVTAANGRALMPATGANGGDGGTWTIDVGPAQVFFAIATGANSNLCVVELAGV